MSSLPRKLDQYRQELSENPSPQAAERIIKEYFSFFGNKKPQEELWLLTAGTLTNEEVYHVATAKDRHNLLFFYEFTNMLIEAVHFLHAEKNYSFSTEALTKSISKPLPIK